MQPALQPGRSSVQAPGPLGAVHREMAIRKGEWKERLPPELPVMWQEQISNALPTDIRFGPDQDPLSDAGFCMQRFVPAVIPSALFWGPLGHPSLSTWVFMRFACNGGLGSCVVVRGFFAGEDQGAWSAKMRSASKTPKGPRGHG